MEMILRAVAISDAPLLYSWRNDELTRQMSGNTDPVVYQNHVTWLMRRLKDADCRFWIAEEGHEPVGVIRFDGEPATVSWTVAPEARGRGVCKRMAAMALEHEGRVVAHVRPDNLICQKVLSAVGFKNEGAGEDGLHIWVREEVNEERVMA